MSIGNERFSGSAAQFFNAHATIGIDRFIVTNVSIGFGLGGAYFDNRGYGATTLVENEGESIAGGVRFGVNLPFGRWVSWYPRLTLSVSSQHSAATTLESAFSAPSPSPVSQSSIGPALDIHAPLLFHVAPHLVLGFGPQLSHDFAKVRGGPYDGAQSTRVSADVVVGGWWGEHPLATASDTPPEKEPSLGAKGQWVLGIASDAWISLFSYSRELGSTKSYGVEPSVDYFVAEEISLGVEAFISHGGGTSRDVSSAVTDYTATNAGLAARVGQLVNLTGVLACWPRVEFGYGASSRRDSSAAGTNEHSSQRSWLKLSLPFLANVTSHFFVGAAPYFFHELSDTDQYKRENDATEEGIDLMLGGWL